MNTNTELSSRFGVEPEPAEPSTVGIDAQNETLFFDNVTDALSAAAPPPSSLRVIGFDRADVFMRLGYRLTDGAADVCIARGGSREFAAARTAACKKLILSPTHAYSESAACTYRANDKSFTIVRRGQKPFAAVFDATDAHQNVASIFGEIVSLDLAAFDLGFAAYMRGERIDGSVAEDAARLVTELTAELKPLEKQQAPIRAAVVAAGKRAARLVEKNPDLPYVSGAAQATEAYRMLCSAEDRPLGMRGETEMIFGGYVLDYYVKSLLTDGFWFPPDNNKRMESLCKYLNADVARACLYTSPIFPPKKLKLYEYRLTEFKTELMRMLSGVQKRRAAAWQLFKRLYPDDGYCLKTIVDKTDVALCIALAPDVLAADSLLAYFKQTGRLEKYIV